MTAAMPTYLYCIVPDEAAEPPRALAGVAGAPVRAARAGALRLWVSELPGPVPAPSVEGARAHEAVVRAAMASATPLPARFGQSAADEAALAAALAPRAAALAAALARVRGMVEMTVRARAVGGADGAVDTGVAEGAAPGGGALPPAGAPGRGRAYLEGLRARARREAEWRRRAGFLQAEIAHAVAPMVAAEARGPEGSAGDLVIAHLVPRDRADAYRAALRALAGRHPEVRLAVTGPWAPYSFAPDA